jgi:hypothetical protein
MNIQDTLKKHKLWLERLDGGERANLCGANLCGANLCGANLCGADLRDADLRDANLRDADLSDANLCEANLCGADLRDANLCGVNLCGANLCGANLCGANLSDADLCGADLSDANLRDADLRGADLRDATMPASTANKANQNIPHHDRQPRRSEVLQQAEKCITQDRAATHGDAEDSFALIGQLWGVWLDREITAYDVAMMMSLFKVARAKGNPAHADNHIDLIGYAALAAEMAAKGERHE